MRSFDRMGNRAFQSAAVVRDLFMQRLPAALNGKAVR